MNQISINSELIRTKATASLEATSKAELCQFFTPFPIAQFMASLFSVNKEKNKILDPGCGSGVLSAALINHLNQNRLTSNIGLTTFDIDSKIIPFLEQTCSICKNVCESNDIDFTHKHFDDDFILDKLEALQNFDFVILNPPYKKIASNSTHRQILKERGIDTVNLYSAFVAKSIQLLKPQGELVAIIPRSFCNGPYYQSFRKFLLSETSIKHIHIFESRKKAFSDDQVLQENIIIHCVKGEKQGKVTITSSTDADFGFDEKSGHFCTENMTRRLSDFNQVVKENDPHNFIHIATNDSDQAVIDRVLSFSSTLEELNIEVSTGPVIGFRLRESVIESLKDKSAGLIYSSHLKNIVKWPITKKPNAILINDKTRNLLWENTGSYLLVDRFSSKEQSRRINSHIYTNDSIPSEYIGFDNKLNVFHSKKKPIELSLVKGLFVYLNCRLIDKYYRLFGGHTQVNATDLRNINYPSKKSLIRMGDQLEIESISQERIDKIIEMELSLMTNTTENPLDIDKKIQGGIKILELLGFPKEQQNERSSLTLLALINLKPAGNWQQIENPMIGVTPIMDWMKTEYGKNYAPNTRETIRRQTLHQFLEAGICLYNPDQLDRAINSPKACYQITPELKTLIKTYGTENWTGSLDKYLQDRTTLAEQYAMERTMQMIPLTLPSGEEIKLSAGEHSQLIKDIVIEFGPRFAPGSEVIYLGDTGAKQDFFNEEKFLLLGITLNKKGKLPDVVLYWEEKNWLLLIESVTSHGPVDGKRYAELQKLFQGTTAGLVFVTAFPDRKVMNKYLPVISWETEVWVADAPSHMIHFNGDRFLGPH